MSLNFGLISSEFKFNVVSDSERVVYVFEGYRLDRSLRMLYRGDRELALPPKAVETLTALIDKRGKIVSKDDLISAIWPNTVVDESNLAQHLHVLRKALGQTPDGKPFIETFRGRGYRFGCEVRVTSDAWVAQEPSSRTTADQVAPVAAAEADNDLGLQTSLPHSDDARIPSSRMLLVSCAAAMVLIVVLAGYFYLPDGHVSASRRGEISVVPLTNGSAVMSATISADGKYFVYHESDEGGTRVWLQQTGLTGRVKIDVPSDWQIGPKTFSPDGDVVYFIGKESNADVGSLFRVPKLGGPVTKLISGVASPVTLSPDSSQIAFFRTDPQTRRPHIVVATADGAAVRTILEFSPTDHLSGGPAWSPDGAQIAFGSVDLSRDNAEGACSVSAVAVRSGVVRKLTEETWDTCYRMAWTPRGDGLVFVGTRASESYTTRRDQIYQISVADGSSRRVTTDSSRYQSASLGVTNDGSILAVPMTRISQVWKLNSDGDAASAVQLTNGSAEGLAGVASLPDGRVGYLNRVGDDRGIWLMENDGSGQRQIHHQFPFIEELRATPDGSFFVFSARHEGFSHIYRVDSDGRNLKQLTDGESYEVDPAISPDGRWVYYASNFTEEGLLRSQFRKTAIDGSETVVLQDLDPHRLFVPTISPDGSMIAAATAGKVSIFSSVDVRELTSIEIDRLGDLQGGAVWTPDGKAVTYPVYRENVVNLWLQPIDGSPARPLTNFSKGYIYFHAFSGDGTTLYLARGHQVRDAVLIKSL